VLGSQCYILQIRAMKDRNWPSLRKMGKYSARIFHIRLRALRTKPTHKGFSLSLSLSVCVCVETARVQKGETCSDSCGGSFQLAQTWETSSIPTCARRRCLRTASEFAVVTPKRIVWTVSNPYFHQNVDMQYSGMEEGQFKGLRELITQYG
jgi:hypothetical protein